MPVFLNNSKYWEDQFIQKFQNFGKKSPVLLSMSVKIQGGEKGALITHVNSNTKYFWPFNYDINVKDFIAEIKKVLVKNHYPRLIEEILEQHQLTSEELALELEHGKDIDSLNKYEMRVIGNRLFRIDKILTWKNIAILTLETSSFEDDEIESNYRYKFNGSIVIFLKNYRTGKYRSLEEASEHFFANSNIIDKIIPHPHGEDRGDDAPDDVQAGSTPQAEQAVSSQQA
jgi:hypothetical protein